MPMALPPILAKYNMKMNAGKTEHTDLTHARARSTNLYVLCNYLSRDVEVIHYIWKFQVALNAIFKI